MLTAIYDVDEEEEKLDLDSEFQYIPESCGLDRSHSEPDGWKSSFQLLREGLSSGAVLAQFDVSHPLISGRSNGVRHVWQREAVAVA